MAKTDDAGKPARDWGGWTPEGVAALDAKAEAASKAKPEAPKPSEPPPALDLFANATPPEGYEYDGKGRLRPTAEEQARMRDAAAKANAGEERERDRRTKGTGSRKAGQKPPPPSPPPSRPSEATTAREALEAFAFEAWTAAKRKGDPEVPTVEALAAWLPDAPPGIAPQGEAARYDVVALPRWSQREPHGIVEDGTDWLIAAHRDLGGGVSAIGAAVPLGPVVAAWQARPKRVPRNRGRAGRYPAVLAQGRDGFGRGRDLLPPLAGKVSGASVQYSLLPDLGEEYDEYGGEFLAAALPVELYTTKGKGAPLDVRMALEAIFDVNPAHRTGDPVAPPAVPWGHLLARIYPGRRVSKYAGSSWPQLESALLRLLKDPRWDLPVSNGRGGWEADRVVVPIKRPLTGHPSERVRFSVTLPRSGPRGSIHDRQVIALAGARSTPALALASGLPVLWDRPGDTRRALGSGGYEQVEDPRAYPLLSLRSVVSLMYPGGPPARKRWPALLDEARALLDWLGEIGYATWDREPGGRRVAPGPAWPGWTATQQPLIGPPK